MIIDTDMLPGARQFTGALTIPCKTPNELAPVLRCADRYKEIAQVVVVDDPREPGTRLATVRVAASDNLYGALELFADLRDLLA